MMFMVCVMCGVWFLVCGVVRAVVWYAVVCSVWYVVCGLVCYAVVWCVLVWCVYVCIYMS